MLASVQNDTSYPASLPFLLAGRGAPSKRRKAKHARGSMLSQQDPLIALTSFQFDATRNVLTRTDARGYLTATSSRWDNEIVLQELDSSLVVQAQYTDYPGYWGGLSSERRGGTSSYYGVDQQSSVRILVGSTGAVTDSYAYKAFGVELAVSGSSVNSYRYVGQYGYCRDSAAMQYVRARYPDVQAGRWVSRDPIGYDGGDWNLYRYVGNEPVSADRTRSASVLGTYAASVPGGTNRHHPPNCLKFGKGCKAVYFTCYEPGRRCSSDAPHCLAVYCLPNQKCGKNNISCGKYCACEGSTLGGKNGGNPVFNRGSWVCIIGKNGRFCRKINDCGCGQLDSTKPTPDNWMDWGAIDCSTFKDGWRCVCPGFYNGKSCTGCGRSRS